LPSASLARHEQKETAANIEVFRPSLAGVSKYPGAYVLLRVAAVLVEKQRLNDRSPIPQRACFRQKDPFLSVRGVISWRDAAHGRKVIE
jgi:hypothetical protein